ncbi:MAG: type II toxin-antitoxin system RelE/ParE family toxin [Cyclobacteriaceae bacterium]
MALEIRWTRRAQIGYDQIIEYLETQFTESEVRRFVQQTEEFFQLLSTYPELLERTQKHKHLHRGPINKYTILTYRVKPVKKQIELINIRSSRKKPLK